MPAFMYCKSENHTYRMHPDELIEIVENDAADIVRIQHTNFQDDPVDAPYEAIVIKFNNGDYLLQYVD